MNTHYISHRTDRNTKTKHCWQHQHSTQHSCATYFELCRCNRNSSMHKLIMIHSLAMGNSRCCDCDCTAWTLLHLLCAIVLHRIAFVSIDWNTSNNLHSAQPHTLTNFLNQQIQVDTATGTRHTKQCLTFKAFDGKQFNNWNNNNNNGERNVRCAWACWASN